MHQQLILTTTVGKPLDKVTFAVAIEIGGGGGQSRNIVGCDAHIGKGNRVKLTGKVAILNRPIQRLRMGAEVFLMLQKAPVPYPMPAYNQRRSCHKEYHR